MEKLKTIIKKSVSIITIFIMIMTQYAITGLIETTYAIDLNATNHDNVQFIAYFKNGQYETNEIESDINSKDLKLRIDVAVKNQGYLENGQISLENAGFIFKQATSYNYINSIENNVINLKKIDAGVTISIEVGIEYLNDDNISISSLKGESTVKLTGQYIYGNGSETISGVTPVTVKWKMPNIQKAELVTTLLTKSTYKLKDETNKKIVQFLIQGKLPNNAYPIKNTRIMATIPEGATKVEVRKRTTKSTNGDKEFTEANYSVENNILTINVDNSEVDGKISWMKGVEDKYIVTYEYPEDIDLSNKNITINENITTYDINPETGSEKVLSEQTQIENLDEEKDGIASIEKDEEEGIIYKGNIYSGQPRDITTYSTVYIDYAEGIKELELSELSALYTNKVQGMSETDIRESNANVDIKSIKINKQKVESVLGENWNLTIGETEINKDTPADENGNISIQLAENTKDVLIKASEPLNNGSFVIETTKTILNSGDTRYTRDQIKEFTYLKDKCAIGYTKNDNNSRVYGFYFNIMLKEPVSTVRFESQQQALIATEQEQNLDLKVIFESKGENQDLFKNPTIEIELPEQIKNVTYLQKPQIVFGENIFEIAENDYTIKEVNGKKVIDIKLTGEQREYLQAINEIEVIINTKVSIDPNAQNSEEEIVLTYKNENETKYTEQGNQEEQGTRKIDVQIIANQNQEQNQNQGENQETGETQGQGENQQQGSNQEPNQSQGGSQEQNQNQGENQESGGEQGQQEENQQQGTNQGANQSQGQQGENQQPTGTQNENQELQLELTAEVGGEEINQGETVKAGEIISYTAKIRNAGNVDITGLIIESTIPENTKLVEINPLYPGKIENSEAFSYTEPYYIEKTDTKITKDNISIQSGKEYIIKYLARVNKDLNEEGNAISTLTVKKNDTIIKETQLSNSIEPAGLVLELTPYGRKANSSIEYNIGAVYMLKIYNNTDSVKENVKVTINKNELIDINSIEFHSGDTTQSINKENQIFTIPSIPVNDIAYVRIQSTIQRYTDNLDVAQISVEADNNDKNYKSNIVVEEVIGEKVDLELNTETTSKNTNKYVDCGDIITYTSKVKNVGKTDISQLEINTVFSNYLDLQSVKVNGENITDYIREQHFKEDEPYDVIKIENLSILKGREIIIEIKGKVSDNLPQENDLIIMNKVTAYGNVGFITDTWDNNYYVNGIKEEYVKPEENEGDDKKDKDDQQDDEKNNHDNNNNDNNDNNNNNEKNGQNVTKVYSISGTVWNDKNRNGGRQQDETIIQGVEVYLINVDTNKIVKSSQTDYEGKYILSDIEKGKYMVAFEYDIDKYDVTTYKVKGVSENKNSDAVKVDKVIDNQEKTVAITDVLVINSNLTDIDLGLVTTEKGSVKIEKTISKIIVTNKEGTKKYSFKDTNIAKVEIAPKYLNGSNVVIEYKFKIKNTGSTDTYIKNIVDNLPATLEFNSSLNEDWYKKDGYLYNSKLNNSKLAAGKEKVVNLVLIKKMTASNTGLVNNEATIEAVYNSDGTGNSSNDTSSADVIIGVKTGVAVTYISFIIISLIILFGVAYLVEKKMLRIMKI